MPKQCNVRQKVYKNATEFVLAIYRWARGLPSSVVSIPSKIPLEKLVSLWEQLSPGDSFLVRDGNACPVLSLSSGTHLAWTCAGAVSLSGGSYVSVPLHLEDTASWCPPSPPALTIFLPPLPQSPLSPEGKALTKGLVLGPHSCMLSCYGSLC